MILLDVNNNLLLQNNIAFTEQLAMDATAQQYITSTNTTDPVRQYAYNVWFTIMKQNNLLNNINVIHFFVNGAPEYDKWNCRLPTTDTDAAFRATFSGINHSLTGITGTTLGSASSVDNKLTALSNGAWTWFCWSFTNSTYTPSLGNYDLELPNSGITAWSGAFLRNASNQAMFTEYGRTDAPGTGGVIISNNDSRGFFLGSGRRNISNGVASLYKNKVLTQNTGISNPHSVSTNTMRIRPNGRTIGMAGATRLILTQNQVFQLYNATQLCFTIMGLI